MHTLTAAQRDTLEALIDLMVPSDRLGPGAREAGVPRFIESALLVATDAATFSAGLEALDDHARRVFGAAFTALDRATASALVCDMEADRLSGFAGGSGAFFLVLRALVLEGMFGDPVYGGNVDYIGWKLIGYPGHKLVVTPDEQRLDVDVPPAYPT